MFVNKAWGQSSFNVTLKQRVRNYAFISQKIQPHFSRSLKLKLKIMSVATKYFRIEWTIQNLTAQKLREHIRMQSSDCAFNYEGEDLNW